VVISGLPFGRQAQGDKCRQDFANSDWGGDNRGIGTTISQDWEKKGMLKVHILSRRRSDMTHEQYVQHWRDVHAPLFASLPDVKRYVRRYIQCFITGDRPEGPMLGETDGLVELWFDDIEGFKAFGNSKSYLEVIKPDEERFTDPKRCEYFFSTERPIID
jgi:uncharacterized protein (TIGR02118 family)